LGLCSFVCSNRNNSYDEAFECVDPAHKHLKLCKQCRLTCHRGHKAPLAEDKKDEVDVTGGQTDDSQITGTNMYYFCNCGEHPDECLLSPDELTHEHEEKEEVETKLVRLALTDIFKDPKTEKNLKLSVMSALSNVGVLHKSLAQLFIESLEDPEWLIRERAALGLTTLMVRYEGMFDALTLHITDDVREVRFASIDTLALLGRYNTKLAKNLIEVSRNKGKRLAKINSCATLCDLGVQDDSVIEAFFDAMIGDKDEGDIKKRILILLKRLDVKPKLLDPRWVLRLIESFPNSSEYIELYDLDQFVDVVLSILKTGKSLGRYSAARAFFNLTVTDEKVKEALVEATKDVDAKVAAAAKAAYDHHWSSVDL